MKKLHKLALKQGTKLFFRSAFPGMAAVFFITIAVADKINWLFWWLYPPLPVVVWGISVAVEYYELKQRGVK